MTEFTGLSADEWSRILSAMDDEQYAQVEALIDQLAQEEQSPNDTNR